MARLKHICHVNEGVACLSALPWNVRMSFRRPPWLAPGLEAGREGMAEQLCRETEALPAHVSSPL